ncbi:MAG: type II toxin-antitoxin system RatA family toxin [Pseudomonadota bacterium]
MVKVERSALMAFTPEQLLALVQDVARYPEYMPGCVGASVQAMEDSRVQAGLQFKFAGLTESFLTENTVMPLAEGHLSLQMRLLRGPFKSLVGQWQFQPLGQGACKVSLSVQLDWGTLSLGRLLAPQLDRAVGHVMQAFKQQAGAVYG